MAKAILKSSVRVCSTISHRWDVHGIYFCPSPAGVERPISPRGDGHEAIEYGAFPPATATGHGPAVSPVAGLVVGRRDDEEVREDTERDPEREPPPDAHPDVAD